MPHRGDKRWQFQYDDDNDDTSSDETETSSSGSSDDDNETVNISGHHQSSIFIGNSNYRSDVHGRGVSTRSFPRPRLATIHRDHGVRRQQLRHMVSNIVSNVSMTNIPHVMMMNVGGIMNGGQMLPRISVTGNRSNCVINSNSGMRIVTNYMSGNRRVHVLEFDRPGSGISIMNGNISNMSISTSGTQCTITTDSDVTVTPIQANNQRQQTNNQTQQNAPQANDIVTEDEEDEHAVQGLDEYEIDAFPLHTYESSSASIHESCIICLSDLVADELLRTLPCCHKFHILCIDPWLMRKAVCPVCLHVIQPT